jgi:DNA-binding response OmpR family regulator
MFIEASGMKARVAYSPSQALELADAEPFAIAILDIGLPGMDGYELARKLRRSRHGSRMNLFALTGYGDEADLARSRRAGFRRHFVKPVEGTTLLAALVDEAIRGPRGQA